jgi:hypothetical protein
VKNSVAVLFFILMVAFLPFMANAAMAPRWTMLAVGVPLLLTRVALPTTRGALLGAGFMLYSAASLLWHPLPWFGALALWQWLLLAGVFCVGSHVESLKPVAKACAAGITISSFISIAQMMGWNTLPAINVPAGLFVNKNTMSEMAGLVVVLLLSLRMYSWLPLVLPAFLLPMCRGAIVGVLIAGVCAAFRRRIEYGVFCLLTLIGGGLLLANMRPETIAIRLTVWKNTIAGFTFFGNGAGSFFILYPKHSQDYDIAVYGRPIQVHNDFLEMIFDLGIGSLFIFGVVVVALCAGLPRYLRGKRYENEATAAWMVLVAGLGMALFEFPLRMPASAALVALVAGRLCSLRNHNRVAMSDF